MERQPWVCYHDVREYRESFVKDNGYDKPFDVDVFYCPKCGILFERLPNEDSFTVEKRDWKPKRTPYLVHIAIIRKEKE